MNPEKPIFQQIMEMIEDNIILGKYQAGDMIISTTQISKLLSVNPTTAVKAVSILTDQGILYKKRGLGMCVAEGAKEKILENRRKDFFEQSIPVFISEANKIGISKDELLKIIKEHKND